MTNTLQLNSRKQSHLLPIGSCDKPSVYGIFFNMENKIEYKEYKGNPRFDLMGKKFNRFTVIGCAGTLKWQRYSWICKCECGKVVVIDGGTLKNGAQKSCGCFRKDKDNAIPPDRRRRERCPIVAGVYTVTNPIGEIYVGSSKTIYKRWLRHREASRKLKFHYSIKQYGWKEHKWEIIEEHSQSVTEAELVIREQFYIDKFKSEGHVMLNVKEAGSSGKFSEESKRKMSEAQRGKWTFQFKFNGEIITITDGLKKYCQENGLSDRAMSALFNSNGHYAKRNYYKGYSRI